MPSTKSRSIEDYLGSYEIILAHRIAETITMFDEGLSRWFRHQDQRTTLKQRRAYKTITMALAKAKDHRRIFIQMHKDIPTKLLADLFDIPSPRVSEMKYSRKEV